MPSKFRVFMNNKEIPISDVHKWESERAQIVLSRIFNFLDSATTKKVLSDMNLDYDHLNDLKSQRKALAILKSYMGHNGIEKMIENDLWWADKILYALVSLSCGKQKQSAIEVFSETGNGQDFLNWILSNNDESKFLGAIPDHYIFRKPHENELEVIETTGGAPFTSQFFIKDDLDGVSTRQDPNYPIQWTGTCRLKNGLILGGLRHQFRNEENGGFWAKLNIDFPILTLPSMIEQHRWHLACEFTKWFEFAENFRKE